MGGFHISGCIAMLPELPREMREAQDLGISFFAGEAEGGRLDQVLRDAWVGKLADLYNFMDDLPSLDGEAPPILPRHIVRRTTGIGVEYRSRARLPLSMLVLHDHQRAGAQEPPPHAGRSRARRPCRTIAQGIKRFFITDDNFARNREWESLFDRMIEMKVGENMDIGFTMQVDTLCHQIPNFIEKAAEAGVRRVFIGLENINPDNLIAAKKRQNKITEYRAMLQKWRDHGAITCAGYILGFPGDTKESILRDIEIIKRELPLDILEFFYLTPLPGSEDHKVLWQKGVWMDPDLNKYDLNHRVSHHPKMSDEEWEDAYHSAWRAYYSPEHIRTILRRIAQHPLGYPKSLFSWIVWFCTMIPLEGVHPLEGGMVRLKFRRDRRHGMPRESPWVFYPRYVAECAVKLYGYWSIYRRLKKIYNEVVKAPDRRTYTDLAIAPPKGDEFESLDLYHATSGGEAALARKRSHEAIVSGAPAKAGAQAEATAAIS